MMNIFEYLGLDKNHRKAANKVTQLVKHWDDVTDKNKPIELVNKRNAIHYGNMARHLAQSIAGKANPVSILDITGTMFTPDAVEKPL